MNIGILGTDNSRTLNFAKLINLDNRFLSDFEDVKVSHIFGLEDQQNQKVKDEAAVEVISKSADELIDAVDLVFIEFRDGRLHRKYAERAIEAGKPLFVDKPLAVGLEDASAIIRLADKKNVPVLSFSTVKYAPQFLEWKKTFSKTGKFYTGSFGCKADPDSVYGGLYFYAVHAVEMMIDVFGYDVEQVYATSQNSNIVATVRYSRDYCITLHLFNNAAEGNYWAAVMGLESFSGGPIKVKGHLEEGLKKILSFFNGGTSPVSKKEMLANVAILQGLTESLQSLKPVSVSKLLATYVKEYV